MTDEKIQQLVRKYIQRWTSQQGHSLSKLAELTSVDYKTVHRYSHGKHVPSAESFMPLSEVVCSYHEALEILDHLSPSNAALFRKWKDPNGKPGFGLINLAAETQFEFWIYSYCTKLTGTTHGEIRERFGSFGLAVLDKLMTLGTIKTENGRIIAANNDTVMNERTNRLAIKYLNELCPESCVDNPFATRCWQVQGLNEPSVSRITRKVRDLERDIKEEFENGENFGEITWVFTMVSESFLNSSNRMTGDNQ